MYCGCGTGINGGMTGRGICGDIAKRAAIITHTFCNQEVKTIRAEIIFVAIQHLIPHLVYNNADYEFGLLLRNCKEG